MLLVGTICHGPQVPAALGLLRGRTTAAYPPLKVDMDETTGGHDAPSWSGLVIRLCRA